MAHTFVVNRLGGTLGRRVTASDSSCKDNVARSVHRRSKRLGLREVAIYDLTSAVEKSQRALPITGEHTNALPALMQPPGD
jgi:hypothetical protein